MKDVVCLVVCFAVLLFPAAPTAAQEPVHDEGVARNHFTVVPATSAIVVDGDLSDAAWQSATVVPLTHEWSPGDNTAPPVATECLVTFDGDKLYVGFRAADPDPQQIRAYLADRDTPFLDDTVGFLLDTFNDRRRAFEFRVNPLGVQLEATVSELEATESGETFVDWSWDAIWDSAGRITPQGYEVEIAVPFKQLHFPSGGQPQTWGFLATRTYPRSVVHELWSTRNERKLDCVVCQADSIDGFQRVETGHNLEVVPTVTASRTDARPTLGADLESGDEEAEAGLSVRWGITPSVTLNATANPDFSQVEADVAQLAVNERFALFFPEKRPFFLEGADYYSTPLPILFTRTVADPKLGLKLTGKEGPHVFGVFAAQDRVNNLIIPGPEGSSFDHVDEDVTTAVLRYRRDIGQISNVGLLYTGRRGEDDYQNQVFGIDAALRPSQSDTIRVQALGSSSRYDEAVALRDGQPLGTFEDYTLSVDYTHETRYWFWGGSLEDRGDDFRADSGFLPQVGIRYLGGVVRRVFWGQPGGWFSRMSAEINSSRLEDQKGDLIEADANLFLTYSGPLQSFARLRILPNDEGFQGKRYNNTRADLLLNMRPRGDLFVEIFLRGGEIIDIANNRAVNFRLVQPRVQFRLGRSMSGELQHAWEEFSFEGDRFIKVNLTQTKLVYHLNLRTFLRLILQYQDLEQVPELFNHPEEVQPEEKTLFTQFLFSYKLNPQTVLLAGYSDDYLGTQEIDIRQRDRTFFLKVGYAWLW